MLKAERERAVAIGGAAHPALAPAAAQDSRAPTTEEIIRKLMQPKLKPDDLKSNAVQVEGRRPRAQAARVPNPASISPSISNMHPPS